MIDDAYYIDGAYIGGSNPPIEPLTSTFSSVDALVFIMTNPPQEPITCRKQSDLTHDDAKDTDELILHQSYDHIAYLLDQRAKGANIPPIHIVWPQVAKPYTQAQKQQTDTRFISELFTQGINDGRATFPSHKSLIKKSSHSLKSLREKALSFYPA